MQPLCLEYKLDTEVVLEILASQWPAFTIPPILQTLFVKLIHEIHHPFLLRSGTKQLSAPHLEPEEQIKTTRIVTSSFFWYLYFIFCVLMRAQDRIIPPLLYIFSSPYNSHYSRQIASSILLLFPVTLHMFLDARVYLLYIP